MRPRSLVVVFAFAAACSHGVPSGTSSGTSSGGAGGTPADAGGPDAGALEGGPSDAGADASYRDPLVQPFASTSIWNVSIGSAATYVPAEIAIPTGSTVYGDEDVIVLTPTAPSTPLYRNTTDWSSTTNRCTYDGGALIYEVPLPAAFVLDTPTGDTPNSGLAALLADGRTLQQTQPFARCTAGAPGTSDFVSPEVDLYSDGIPGAHGGSGLSAIGGTLRVGELRPGAPPPHHALKIELFAAENYYNDGQHADCYRWPASECDGYFDDATSPLKYGGTNPSMRPGSLLALPASVSLASLNLTTEPAQSLAWTLQNYGAYVVDDSAWSSMSVCVEHGPAGSFKAQFQGDWGFSFDTDGTTSAFAKDMAMVIGALNVVDNNTATTIGGGGTPREPPALPLPPVTAGDD